MAEPALMLSLTEEQLQLRDLVREVVKNEVVPVRMELDEKNEYPRRVLEKFREAGIFQALFPEEYGGLGMGMMANIILSEEIAYGCLGVGTAFLATKLGSLPIEVGATEEQKKKWLPQLASGEKVAAFGLTEPGAGSDVPALSTTAVKKGDRYILNGTKQWISGAGQADYYTVFALTAKDRGPRGMSCFLVEKGWKGFSFGKKEDKLGIRCSETRQLIFEDCEVPAENIVGGRENNGFLHALKTLNLSRPAVAAQAVGTAQGAFDCAVQYAREREQFGVKIATFQAIQHMLADMAIRIEGSRLLTYKSAALAEVGHKDTAKFSAMAKCYAADSAMAVATDAIQIYGGYGYTKEYPVEKYFRDAKILQIYEGTSQIQKNEIAAGLIKEAASKVRA
ncbi:MAG TPA: acyl-CoA dehydrogenase family protein [Leptospiraceae bacterium]|nr:acyl-CoA dehydrogenase family protein [Leptospirales bacterium]HMU82659.1 acyl-CoA dehydrogenase family protein [Leptospiraceae bacterium]HMX57195.1 acyl-CoA dehydrogenase family protein [Leptospiraceae bacterium]HMZ35141.1 acyl-CoA dehydrogenase family protein [Leptospiraceae bacterium]HNJ33268.1 acyl-CoA dehydrogenase family protein [Leptospiraceae bacterium]